MIRRVALDLLLRAQRTGEFVDRLVDARAAGLADPRESAFLRAVVYGAVRHRATLDAVAAAHARSGRPPKRPRLREILRLAIFQMLFLERVPAHAVIHEAVEMARGRHGRDESRFVNAVLRAVQRGVHREAAGDPSPYRLPLPEGGSLRFERAVFPDPARGPVAHLAAVHSHPEVLVGRWCDRFGAQGAEAILRAGNRIPPLTLRARPAARRDEILARLEAAGIRANRGALEDSIRVRGRARVEDLPGFDEGAFAVQAESSIEAGHAARARPGDRVLDVGAAPGGKTAQLADAVAPDGRVVAIDVAPGRLARLARNLRRLRPRGVLAVCLDARRLPPALEAAVDRAFVDAPCSNTGVLARRPEARWRYELGSLRALAVLQRELLEAAAAAVRPGGTLVYSTCSIEREENEEVVASVLRPARFEIEEERLQRPGDPFAEGGYFARARRPG